MTDHPSAFRLEAWHAGETCDEVEAHAADCAACRAYIEGLEMLRASFLEGRDVQEDIRGIRALAERDATPGLVGRFWKILAPAATVMAAFLLYVALPVDHELPNSPDTIRLKGSLSLAVIVDRNGSQVRSEGATELLPGDRIRVELRPIAAGPLAVGLLDESEGWTSLVSERVWEPGVHVLEGGFRVDEKPMRACLVAGSPVAMESAKALSCDVLSADPDSQLSVLLLTSVGAKP
jgi:hypothetical protein